MATTPAIQTDATDSRHRFSHLQKLLADPQRARELAEQTKGLLVSGQTDGLTALLNSLYPPDIADILAFLDDAEDQAVFRLLDIPRAAEVLDEVDACTREQLVQSASREQVAQVVEQLPTDEGTDIVQALKPDQAQGVLALVEPARAEQIHMLMAYPPESAGGIMSLGFVAVPETATLGQAEQAFQERTDAEPLLDIFVVDANGALKGALDLRRILAANPSTLARDAMVPILATVPPEMDREKVARIFARYDLTALPVIQASNGRVLGVITSDDVIDVIQEENTEDMLRMAGSDAQEMERRSPARTALLRLPWILATMFIELGAGVVIHLYDQTLAKVLLLASFMPIISAISGNTGLQSATIIVRGISTGQVQVTAWRRALLRQLVMTLLLGAATGLTLGVIGAVWYGKWTFGLVVCIGMFAAVNIAGVVGTVVPLISKSLGFDPAITSGPFETAFQDVVGISIFLTLATLMIPYLVK